ncbi:MAG: DUF2225 domain-containing protein [Pseudomonadota bacterium]|jgi:uncharacterized protein (DUF2225 family)
MMAPLSNVELNCPCCGGIYRSDILEPGTTPGPTTTDFFSMSAGEQPIHYQVHTCPFCGYSFEEMEEGEIRDDVRRFVSEVITPQLSGEELPSWKKFEFLALIDEVLGAGFYMVGMMYLHAAWCCYDLNYADGEKYYRERAIYQFLRELESDTVDQDLVYLIPYLLAEQYRRTGQSEEARRWYDRVMELDDSHPDSGFFMTLAAQQKLDPKEYMGEIIHEEP